MAGGNWETPETRGLGKKIPNGPKQKEKKKGPFKNSTQGKEEKKTGRDKKKLCGWESA